MEDRSVTDAEVADIIDLADSFAFLNEVRAENEWHRDEAVRKERQQRVNNAAFEIKRRLDSYILKVVSEAEKAKASAFGDLASGVYLRAQAKEG